MRVAAIAGPCSVENEEQIVHLARQLKAMGATGLRGARTSRAPAPTAFRAHKELGLGRCSPPHVPRPGWQSSPRSWPPEHVPVVAEYR